MSEFVERTRRVVSLRMNPFCAVGCSALALPGNADDDGAATVGFDLSMIRSIVSVAFLYNYKRSGRMGGNNETKYQPSEERYTDRNQPNPSNEVSWKPSC